MQKILLALSFLLLLAALLGPAGYFGVKIFSRHDEMMCYQAGRGFKVWGMIVTSMLLLGVAVALKANADSVSPLLNACGAPLCEQGAAVLPGQEKITPTGGRKMRPPPSLRS
jgi:hypothetical protein